MKFIRRLLTWLFDKRVLEAINRGDSYDSVVALVDRLTCDKQEARAAQGVGGSSRSLFLPLISELARWLEQTNGARSAFPPYSRWCVGALVNQRMVGAHNSALERILFTGPMLVQLKSQQKSNYYPVIVVSFTYQLQNFGQPLKNLYLYLSFSIYMTNIIPIFLFLLLSVKNPLFSGFQKKLYICKFSLINMNFL